MFEKIVERIVEGLHRFAQMMVACMLNLQEI